jgi:SPP1 family predicted phage head-tail adaptor
MNTPTVNSTGETVDTWTDAFTVWAAIEPLTGSRLFQAQQANSEVKGVVRIRYRPDVIATMRMIYGSMILQVVSLMNTAERNEQIEILYKEALD